MTKSIKVFLKIGLRSFLMRKIIPSKKSNSVTDIPQVLNVFFPGKCNLQCTYCFVHKEKESFNDINEEAIRREIDIFFNYPGKKKVLSFNGGEPLLEWDLIKKTHAYAKQQAKKKELILSVTIVTNGTLLKQKNIDFFKRNNISLRISIDGKKDAHDKLRPFKGVSGKSSFEVIMKNIQAIKHEKFNLSASLVFGPQTAGNLLDNIKFLQQVGFKYIDFFPEMYAIWSVEELKKFQSEAKKISKYYINIFTEKKDRPFKNSMLDTILHGLDIGKQEYCGKIQGDSLGNFFVCDKVFSLPKKLRNEYLIGNVKNGINNNKREHFLEDLRKEFSKETSLSCASCELKKYCFCPIGQYIYNKNAEVVDPKFWKSFCTVSKILIKMNLDIIKKLKYNDLFVRINRF